ncbi:CrcB family protein [Brachybacterium huguangmaarense]|uniref:Fluoride-specific ion channel FluC n=1 Tax=Brachybacterium huguangmaarense TaxID=1652028 RepID=A0ABY6G325_9MICO|nr:CrcB family protein [Brachybacterium huguangmaarense]UYG17609.1 CrcB family protein [Brachybacterium huguangmaarense]
MNTDTGPDAGGRPLRRRPPDRLLGFAALVGLGSMVGTLLRASIEQGFAGAAATWPWPTFVINLVGSLVLGALLETLGRLGQDTGRRRVVRLAGGTGVIGGFTTYSTYALEIDQLARSGDLLLAVLYAVISLVAGVAAAAIGLAAATALMDRRSASREQVR